MLFKSRAEKELDEIIKRLNMNLSNNYKDNAQDNLAELKKALAGMKESGEIRAKALKKYEDVYNRLESEMQGFTHKDQKPYWH